MPIKIKFIKKCDEGKVGDIKNYSNSSAKSLVEQGYAEYINNKKSNTKKDKNNSKKDSIDNSSSNGSVQSVQSVQDVESVQSVQNNQIGQIGQLDKHLLGGIFDDTLTENILKFLAEKNKPFTFGKLAEEISKNEDSIRKTINRKNDFFSVFKKEGVQSVQLSNQAKDEIQRRIEKKEQEIKEEQEKKEFEKQKDNQIKQFRQNIMNFLQNIKPERKKDQILFDFNDLSEYDPYLADLFLDYPEQFLDNVSQYYNNNLDIRLLNLPKTNIFNIEDLRKENLNKLINIQGRVTSMGEVKPLITKIKYECPSCGSTVSMKQNYRTGIIEEPRYCSCGRKGGFHEISREESDACFLQLEDLQEKTLNPHSQRIKGVLFDSMTKNHNISIFAPGNEASVSGILKEVPIYRAGKRIVNIDWILEIIDAELIEKDIQIQELSDDDVEMINQISSRIDQDGLDPLTSSFAPEVWGYDEIKKAIIMQLANKRNDKKISKTRTKSNILLIGDPGVAKSVLGDFAVSVSMGSKKAVGGSSSGVGITASVVKEDDRLGGYRVEPGAMVLAKDILFLDELNNLNEDDKPKLQEGMSEQEITINKANLHVKMNVTCGNLAVANPIHGHFKESSEEPMNKQFGIPTPILNRFDTVFIVRDIIDENRDKNIAEKMIKRQSGELECEYDVETLRKFFAYIKQVPEPTIPQETKEYMKEIHSMSRKTLNSGVPVSPRYLESLMRMSTACAKLRQSDIIEIKDVKEAFMVISESQYSVNKNIIMETEKIKIENER